MKVLFVVNNYFPSVGGTQIFFQNIAEQFANSYHDEVEVFTTDSYYGPNKIEFKKIPVKREVINNVKVFRFPFRRWHKKIFISLKKIFAILFKIQNEFINVRLVGPWSPSLNKAIANTDADVIIAASATFMYMQYGVMRHRLKNAKPFIFQGAIHFHNNFKTTGFSSYTLRAMKAADIYWSNTLFESETVNALGVKKEQIKIVATGIDLKKFENADSNFFREVFNVKENEVLIVCLGRIDIFKGINVFMDSLKELFGMYKNFKAVIAGNNTGYLGPLKKEHSLLDIELRDKIFFLENITEVQKVSLCAAMDMLVLPSVNESFGMVFLEAWASKKPVIGAGIGAVASVIAEGVDGLLFDPDSSKSLALQMMKLCDNKALRDSMGMRGFQKVVDNYTWEKVSAVCRQTCFDAMENFKNNN